MLYHHSSTIVKPLLTAKEIYKFGMEKQLPLLCRECPIVCLDCQRMLIDTLTSYRDVMKSFFEPLLVNALKLIKRSLAKARAAERDVRRVFVCGGGFGNDWFFEDFLHRLLDETEVTACERIQEWVNKTFWRWKMLTLLTGAGL